MLAPVIERLTSRVAALQGRVKGAAELSRLLASNAIRETDRGAYVLPMALRGGQARAATGAFVQEVEELIAVVLVTPSEDPRGARALTTIDTQIDAVIAALAGWCPPDMPGPLRLVQGRMINIGAGALVYHLDFATTTQLRINPA